MTIYAGLDVSDKATHIGVVSSEGTVVRRDVVASDPDVPVICICARHVRGVLSTRVNKSDPHDAEGLA